MRRHTLLVVPVLIVSALVAPSRAVAEAPTPFPEYESMINAYLTTYPGIPLARARTAVLTQGNRARLLEEIGRTARAGFGGNWYDPRTNTQHVLVTNQAAADTVRAAAARHDVDVAVGRARYVLAELDALAGRLNAQLTPETIKERSVFAIADNTTNRVKVITRTAKREAEARARHAKDDRVLVVHSSRRPAPVACTSRNSCGSPMRAGIAVGVDPDASGPLAASTTGCSNAFTAFSTDGAKWMTTAGHCAGGTPDAGVASFCGDGSNGACWGHGTRWWGPLRDSWPIGHQDALGRYANVDAARARKDNANWGTGGYIYHPVTPDSPFDVDYAITMRSTFQIGDSMCHSSRHAVSGSYCGVVFDTTSASGTVAVSGDDVCGGDSGGAYYMYTGGQRWAAGIISMNDDIGTCNNDGTELTYLSTVPDIVEYWDESSTLTIRFEER